MDLLLSSLVALVPLFVGLLIIGIIKEIKLTFPLFLFLIFISIWQIDVTILYGYGIFSIETVDFLFRLFRIGSIMQTPTLFFIAYSIAKRMELDTISSVWRFVVNKYVVLLFYGWGAYVYFISWTDKGIKEFALIQSEKHTSFYFPIYGSHAWVFNANVAFFIVAIVATLVFTLKIKNNDYRSFLFYFIIYVSIGYGLGMLNMFPETRLYPSGVAVVFFAISIFTLLMRLHINIANNVNKELDSQKNFLQTVIDLDPNYIYAKNEGGVLTLVNKAFAEMYGTTPKKLIGMNLADISKDYVLLEELFNKENKSILGEKVAVEEETRDVNGNKKWLQTYRIPFVTPESNLLLVVSSDITKLKNQEKKILTLAYSDDLTHLPNRRLFNDDLEARIKVAEKNDEQLALIFIDLDRFKFINDTLGHDVGDLFLIAVAQRINEMVKRFDERVEVYRIGGDEFTIIFQNCERDSVTKLATKILELLREPIEVENQSLVITPSMGISIYPLDGDDSTTLIKNADAAMYYVKQHTKNSFEYYMPEFNEHHHRKLLVEKQLRTALEKDEFQLYFQPQMDLQTGAINGMEALLRWENEELGSVTPVEFIPIAEETHLIIPIGNWVMREACLQNKKWQEAGFPDFKIAINISMRQFNEDDFVEIVSNVLEETKLNPELLELEITESIAILDQKLVINKLHAVKSLGVKIAIDDFGTGYSTLRYLQKYPIDVLKIDKCFITNIMNNNENKEIVTSILLLAEHLNLDVIAEGVEIQTELDYLSKTSCKSAQGYYIGPPLSADEFQSTSLSR